MSALSKFRILELSESVSGEYCGKLLSDFGARVIKIERPGTGSPTRSLGPFAAKGAPHENSGLFAYLNTNKNSATLDLSQNAGKETLAGLFDRVDVVIDDHPPGWLKSVGLDPATLDEQHPGLVVCAITPYGQSPLDDRRHGEDLNVFHASGWGYHTPGETDPANPPLNGPGRFQPSYEAGLDAALCIAAALYDREATKRGRFIDISKQAVLASRVDYVLGQMAAGDMDTTPSRGAFDLRGPSGIFACRDGYVYIWMSEPSHWSALGQLLGNPAWMKSFPERWLERECTSERVAESRHHIAAWLGTQEKEDVSARGQKLGLTMAALNTAKELLASPQYQFRKFFTAVEHPQMGRADYPTVPYKMSATPARIETPAPLLGQHTSTLSGAWEKQKLRETAS